MSRELEFDGWWEGCVVHYCDNCNKTHRIPFSDESEAKNFKKEREILKADGWLSTKVNGRFIDTCSENCRNEYIRKNTI